MPHLDEDVRPETPEDVKRIKQKLCLEGLLISFSLYEKTPPSLYSRINFSISTRVDRLSVKNEFVV